ncbi:MAG: protein-L-isoaspartate(D-aspartate) O-methyltransferase [Acidimicrobiia bacterium]|nr:protein-L-isoaspartate(D-aspartate) O-methyltransferase [Acidimicrobiia bacterium]
MDDRSHERERMVERQLVRRGIRDERVLAAMAQVPRERFVPPDLADEAYWDGALPISLGQTISQPYIVAKMAELLELGPDDVVLDVGTGCGYAAAVVSRIVRRVWSIERIEALARPARYRLSALGYDNVTVCVGDGTHGWPEHGPYDAIQVAAAASRIPAALKEQLVVDGRLLLPAGRRSSQRLLLVRRTSQTKWVEEPLERVRFVPLVDSA